MAKKKSESTKESERIDQRSETLKQLIDTDPELWDPVPNWSKINAILTYRLLKHIEEIESKLDKPT